MLTASYLRAFDASSAIRLAIYEILQRQESSRRLGVKIGSFIPDFDRFTFVRDSGLRNRRRLSPVKWVVDQAKFYSFMAACAARTGQLLNATDIGNTVDVDRKTVKAWISVLQASNIVRIVEPFWPNVDKRPTKTPKIFFMDTGLVCHLTRWITPE